MDKTALIQIKNNFVKDLQLAEAGQKNSLAFIINQIPPQPLVQDGEIFEVLTIGGSVYRKALIKKSGINLEIIKETGGNLPILATKQILLDCVLDLLEPDITVLAINFAYAIEPIFENNKLDGVLLGGAKEHKFTGLIGEKVGAAVEQYIATKASRQVQVSIANDTICLLLSGLIKCSWNQLAAGIVGTGFNMALFLNQDKLINLEAGSFNNFQQTKEGKIIDKQSVISNDHIFEKEVAGGYLYQHFNLIIKEKELNYPEINSSKELDEACSSVDSQISEIAKGVLKRAAEFVACMVAGILEYRASDLVFVMEGSLFWKGVGYKQVVEETIKQLTSNFKAEFIQVEDSTILGGAKLVA